jgi:hypothetical protein
MQREKGYRCPKSGHDYPHGKDARKARRERAETRAAARAELTPDQQIARLDTFKRTATRERARLAAIIAKTQAAPASEQPAEETSKRVRRHARAELQP